MAPPTREALIKQFGGRPIRNCPGRYVLLAAKTQCAPAELVGHGFPSATFTQTTAKDVVVVTKIENWGLISYARKDGSWCHTVNTPAGFERKLKALGIRTSPITLRENE